MIGSLGPAVKTIGFQPPDSDIPSSSCAASATEQSGDAPPADGPNAGLSAGPSGDAASTTDAGAPLATSSGGFVIDINWDTSVNNAPAAFKTGVMAAVQYLEGLFSNPITITIDVGYGEIAGQALGSNALGESETTQNVAEAYSSVRNALIAQGAPGAATLPATSPDQGTLYMARAEAKALGLYANDGSVDGYVGFSATLPFSYTNGTAPPSNEYYFFGVVEHEITEDMGRVSLLNGQPNYYSPTDLFRYSSPGVRDLTTGGTGSTAYFSVDKGTTNLGSWNNNSSNGDLADWYPSGPAPGGEDSFNDYSSPGVTNVVSQNDVTLMEALGWTPPAPTTTLYDFEFLYNDYTANGVNGGDFYLGTVADNGTFGYHAGERINTSLGQYFIYAVDSKNPTTTQVPGTVNDYEYYDGAGTKQTYTPDYSGYQGFSPGNGLGNDYDYILGGDGQYHPFGGNMSEATVKATTLHTTTLYDFEFLYTDYTAKGVNGGDFYLGTVADDGSLGYFAGEMINTALGHYYVYAAAGTTTLAPGTVNDFSYYDGAGTKQTYTPDYSGAVGQSLGNGLGNDQDFILDSGGHYHLFGGNTGEAIVGS